MHVIDWEDDKQYIFPVNSMHSVKLRHLFYGMHGIDWEDDKQRLTWENEPTVVIRTLMKG